MTINKELLQLLITRRSEPLLTHPAPSVEQTELMIRAALRAADHARLQPWYFIVLQGSNRDVLGEAMLQGALAKDAELPVARQNKIKSKVLRAPQIIIAVSKNTPHSKVPAWEQQLSAAAACQNIINAAFALELGAYWRTGSAVLNPLVKKILGVAESESIIGFIYTGTPQKPSRIVKNTDNWQDFVRFSL